MQALGHQFQHGLLSSRRPVPWRRGPLRRQWRRALPEQLEVLPQRRDDHRRSDHQGTRSPRRRQRQNRGCLIGQLHLHQHTGQQPRLLSRFSAGTNDAAADRVVHDRGVIDRPAAHQPPRPRQRRLGEVLGERHLGLQILQRHPVMTSGVHQRRRQLADLGPARHDRHQMLRKLTVHTGSESCLSVGESPTTVQQQLLVTGQTVLMTSQHTLQRQIRRHRL